MPYKNNYTYFTCLDPTQPASNICPCDPSVSNPTGRGFTQCPFGIYNNPLQTDKPGSQHNIGVGNNFNSKQTAPPQFQPRPMSRIGIEWRS